MKKNRIIALILVIALAVTLFASCGKKVEGEKEVITVGYTIYEPMNYYDADNNFVGYDTDLAKAVFEKLGYAVLFKEINWETKYTDLAAGNIDCIWNGFTANSADDDGVQRSEKVDFSYYYMGNTQVVVVKKGSGITDAASLANKVGYAEAGSAGFTYASSFEGANIQSAAKQIDCLTEVLSGSGDFCVLDESLANSYAGKGDYADLEVVEALKSEGEYYGIGFEKGSELVAKVNGALEELAADGTIASIAKKYGLENTAITDFSSQKK